MKILVFYCVMLVQSAHGTCIINPLRSTSRTRKQTSKALSLQVQHKTFVMEIVNISTSSFMKVNNCTERSLNKVLLQKKRSGGGFHCHRLIDYHNRYGVYLTHWTWVQIETHWLRSGGTYRRCIFIHEKLSCCWRPQLSNYLSSFFCYYSICSYLQE